MLKIFFSEPLSICLRRNCGGDETLKRLNSRARVETRGSLYVHRTRHGSTDRALNAHRTHQGSIDGPLCVHHSPSDIVLELKGHRSVPRCQAVRVVRVPCNSGGFPARPLGLELEVRVSSVPCLLAARSSMALVTKRRTIRSRHLLCVSPTHGALPACPQIDTDVQGASQDAVRVTHPRGSPSGHPC